MGADGAGAGGADCADSVAGESSGVSGWGRADVTSPGSETDESLLGVVSSSLGECRVLSLIRVAATDAFTFADWAAEAGALRAPMAACLAVTLAIGAFRAVVAPTRRLAMGLLSASAAAARVTRVRSASSHLSSPISVFMKVLPAVTAFMSGSSE